MAFSPRLVTERIVLGGYISRPEAISLRGSGITHLLNLHIEYPDPTVFADLGLTMLQYEITDMYPMSQADAAQVVRLISEALAADETKLYVHCNAGVNRSPTALWLYFVATGMPERDATDLIVSANRSLSVPNRILVMELSLDRLRETFS